MGNCPALKNRTRILKDKDPPRQDYTILASLDKASDYVAYQARLQRQSFTLDELQAVHIASFTEETIQQTLQYRITEDPNHAAGSQMDRWAAIAGAQRDLGNGFFDGKFCFWLHCWDIATIYVLFLAFTEPSGPSPLVAGYAMGILFWIVSITPQGSRPPDSDITLPALSICWEEAQFSMLCLLCCTR